MSIIVQRRGSTSSNLRDEETVPQLHWGVRPSKSAKISFTMASAGGGSSDVVVSIPAADFKELAAMMFEADATKAREAFELMLAKDEPDWRGELRTLLEEKDAAVRA